MSQKLVTVVPTLRRPEMLALTLEKLSQTRQAGILDVRIYLDHTVPARLDEVEYVRDIYFPTADIFQAKNHILLPSGTWNILQSLKAGYETGADYIFFVEEDVFVTPDFFDRHLAMQAAGDYFVTCGRKLFYKDETYYSNPGSCYRREKLGLVVPHITNRYLTNPVGYLKQTFPNMDDAGTLDDGLIRRVMQAQDGRALCAVPAIAFHQGFHYYDRMPEYRVEGSLPEKIEQLRDLLQRVNSVDRYTGDFEPYPA